MPTARAASRSWCSKASANTWRCTTTARSSGTAATRPITRTSPKSSRLNLKDVATYFHANAQKSKKPDEYLEAARWYRTYLESFPDDPDSFGTNYLLSETLYEAKDYQGASAEFTRTAYNYPRNPRSAAAAYAALGAYTKYEESLPAAQKAEAHKVAVDAGIKFGTSFPEHPDSAGVLTRAAEDIFATQDLQRSIEVANLVLAHQPPADAPKRRIAYTIIGQANFDLMQFAEAEKGYIAARELLPPNDKMRADLTERIASSVYRQAEAKQKGGDAAGAVEDFLRIAQVAGTSKIAAQAEYDAGAQLIQLKDWPRAITVLERFRAVNPKSEFSADVTRKLAVAYTETGQAGQAAVEFERIALNPAETRDVQREANLTAADLYAKSGNTPKAVGMLERFVVTYPTPVADSIEARQKLADYRRHRRPGRQTTLLAARDHRRGSHRRRRAHRSHAVPRRQIAARTGRAGARRVPQHRAGAAAQAEPGEEAQGHGGGARWLQERG